MRPEIGRPERFLRWCLLALALTPVIAQVLVPLVWTGPYHGHRDELPVPTEFVFEGWPTLFSLTLLVATVATLGGVRRTFVRLSGEVAASLVLLSVACASGFALVCPWFSWAGLIK